MTPTYQRKGLYNDGHRGMQVGLLFVKRGVEHCAYNWLKADERFW